MSKPHILIAGAGIGGIAAALALVQHGFEVSLYEQVAELHELGAGLQISPNGSRVLCELGLRPAMEAIVSRPRSREMRLFNTGQSWPLPSARDDAGFGSPFWLVHRGDFHQTLVATLERSAGASVGARCIGFDRTRWGDVAAGRRRTGPRRCLNRRRWCALAHPEALFGGAPATFTGFMAWRAVVPMRRLPARLRQESFTGWRGPMPGHHRRYRHSL